MKEKTNKKKTVNIIFYLILFFSFIIRIFIALNIVEFSDILVSFNRLFDSIVKNGFGAFYSSGKFTNYTPGYIYIIYIIGIIKNIFSFNDNSIAFLILIKLPVIISDIISCILIYNINKKNNNQILGFFLALLYAFNPVVFYNSAFLDQIESLFILLILLCIILIYDDKIEIASIIYVIAILIKPQALIFLPVGLYEIIKRKNWKLLFNCFGLMFILLIILLLPFSIKQGSIFWIFKFYKNILYLYPYASVNAFNLFSFFGANKFPLNEKYFIFSYKVWGYIFIFCVLCFGIFISIRDYLNDLRQEWTAFFTLFLAIGVYILGPMIHEIYIFPAIALSLVCFSLINDRRLIIIFLGYSITLFINQGYLLNMALNQKNFWINNNDILLRIMSLINILLFIYLIKILVDIFILNKIKTLTHNKQEKQEMLNKDNNLLNTSINDNIKNLLSKKDLILLAILTIAYAFITFANLGSLKSPQTYWEPKTIGNSFIIYLGENKKIKEIRYFFTLGRGFYLISFSKNGKDWVQDTIIEHKNIYDSIKWEKRILYLEASYIKIVVINPGLMFHELGFFDNNNEYIPVKNINKEYFSEGDEDNPNALFDEEETIPVDFSYLNGTYFDEIYYARTAFEHIKGVYPTEISHPPLGKLIISTGILLFGMNTFGWRFMGTLFGVLMVPLMYLFGKRLFKSILGGFATSFIFTFDFMHFVQTRVSAIDSYGVFFIILMYYFMFQYYSMSFYEAGLKKTLIPLLFCGISFGLGCACKWIVIYGSIGLVILFFITIGIRFREYYNAKKEYIKYPEENIYHKNIIDTFPKYLKTTLAFCILFFIIIPIIIYFLSYIPLLTLPEVKNVGKFLIKDQKYMLNYHINLNTIHDFTSPWWEWPFIKRPILYYHELKNHKISSIAVFGNPLVWWIGTIFLILTVFITIKKRNKQMLFVIIAFCSQYLPYVIIPRELFIYHFFAAIPFIVLCIVFIFLNLIEKSNIFKYIFFGYLIFVLILFIMFYPILTGMLVSKGYVENFLKWFQTWNFY